jgi:hypothetical protein
MSFVLLVRRLIWIDVMRFDAQAVPCLMFGCNLNVGEEPALSRLALV